MLLGMLMRSVFFELYQGVPLLGICDLCPARCLWSELPTSAERSADEGAKGLYGAIFSRLNILWSKHVRQGTWVKGHPILEVVLVPLPACKRV